jgi:NADPH2:quinone reductase
MTNQIMRAAWFESFGEAAEVLQLGDQPKPEPAAGEVLVRIHTSGVNPSDVKKRAGAFPNLLDDGLVIPHSDGAGIIEAVGSNVGQSRIGERVWLYQAQFARQLGTAAEYVAIGADRAVAMPDEVEVSFAIGACLGIPVMTAHRCVFADGPVAGKTVLVTGGAGRVGFYAIQWASQSGANVVATASNPDDAALCKSLGAEHVVNHRDADWSEQVLAATSGKRVDRVVDVEFGGNLEQVLKLINTSGVIATYSSAQVREPKLPFLQMMYLNLTIRMIIVYAMPESAKQEAIAAITEGLKRDQLQHRVAHQLGLSQISKAHELIEQGGFGGAVIVHMDEAAI